MTRTGRTAIRTSGVLAIVTTTFLCAACASAVSAQTLLDGEFGDVDLGRELIGADRLPTLAELRDSLAKPAIETVVMFKLFGDEHNHHLPIWSPDGQRLALQRAQEDAGTSHLLIYDSLAEPAPRLLTQEPRVYDYMFRWGVNGEASFVFVRIDIEAQTTTLFFSPDGSSLEARTGADRRCRYPALYERGGGVHWLVYEDGDQLAQQAWNDSQVDQRVLGEGSSPRFNRDGTRLLMTRRDPRSGRLGEREVRILDLRRNSVQVLSRPGTGFVRGPTWSPNEELAAFYHRDASDFSPWRIEVQATDGSGSGRRLVDDVVVNPDYTSEGPNWEPGGKRIWCFSHARREQQYFPLVAVDVVSGELTQVDYPRRVTSPQDLAVNPVTQVPELALVANDGLPRDLFIVFCNHY